MFQGLSGYVPEGVKPVIWLQSHDEEDRKQGDENEEKNPANHGSAVLDPRCHIRSGDYEENVHSRTLVSWGSG